MPIVDFPNFYVPAGGFTAQEKSPTLRAPEVNVAVKAVFPALRHSEQQGAASSKQVAQRCLGLLQVFQGFHADDQVVAAAKGLQDVLLKEILILEEEILIYMLSLKIILIT